MNNYQITDEKTGNKYWISRAIAVTGLVINTKHSWRGVTYVLANKRGKGTPDFQGYWNLPCGYLDFNETTKEAVSREVWEECGCAINPNDFQVLFVNDDPAENRQNVSFRFKAITTQLTFKGPQKGGEKDEVEEVKWIPVHEINKYQWAFNHNDIIKKYVNDSWFKKLLRRLF